MASKINKIIGHPSLFFIHFHLFKAAKYIKSVASWIRTCIIGVDADHYTITTAHTYTVQDGKRSIRDQLGTTRGDLYEKNRNSKFFGAKTQI